MESKSPYSCSLRLRVALTRPEPPKSPGFLCCRGLPVSMRASSTPSCLTREPLRVGVLCTALRCLQALTAGESYRIDVRISEAYSQTTQKERRLDSVGLIRKSKLQCHSWFGFLTFKVSASLIVSPFLQLPSLTSPSP